ncbi:hypothetical protein QNJ95_24390 [Bradyrhizobium elkanii]|uniref:hypothetical protein n=1 Tax=Bradyrhizobium elkanii TaxID=29448 RepID=UPI0027121E7F|nr:hypothetical protein [Bradyrhizobium elkanii]WLA36184.1 hypothetical protein QNJ95_24390 [Bradyrhizobium elkanii]
MTKHVFHCDDDAQAIVDYGLMLVSLLASPDYEEVPDGIRMTVWHMINHAKSIQDREAEVQS